MVLAVLHPLHQSLDVGGARVRVEAVERLAGDLEVREQTARAARVLGADAVGGAERLDGGAA